MLSDAAIASLSQQYFFSWAIGLCVDEMPSLQPCSVNKGCQDLHGLIKIARAKILSAECPSKKNPQS